MPGGAQGEALGWIWGGFFGFGETFGGLGHRRGDPRRPRVPKVRFLGDCGMPWGPLGGPEWDPKSIKVWKKKLLIFRPIFGRRFLCFLVDLGVKKGAKIVDV